MLLNVAAHNVSICNIKVLNRELHVKHSVAKYYTFFNAYVMCTLHIVMV
jgi:hypothetical protein